MSLNRLNCEHIRYQIYNDDWYLSMDGILLVLVFTFLINGFELNCKRGNVRRGSENLHQGLLSWEMF